MLSSEQRNKLPRSNNNDWDLTSLQSIVSKFADTMKQCEDVMMRHSKFDRDGFGFVKNVSWRLGLAERGPIVENSILVPLLEGERQSLET